MKPATWSVCFVRRDGTVLHVLVSATVERRPGDGEVRVIAALVDITSRKRTEAALETSQEGLRHAQKMEAIGQLIGGIAHNFNNVLQAVSGNLGLIRRRVRDDRPDVVRLADNALEAAGKAAELASQLLSFARRQRLDPQPLDAVEVIESMRVFRRTPETGRCVRSAPAPTGDILVYLCSKHAL